MTFLFKNIVSNISTLIISTDLLSCNLDSHSSFSVVFCHKDGLSWLGNPTASTINGLDLSMDSIGDTFGTHMKVSSGSWLMLSSSEDTQVRQCYRLILF